VTAFVVPYCGQNAGGFEADLCPLLAQLSLSAVGWERQQRDGYDAFTRPSGSARFLRSADGWNRHEAVAPDRDRGRHSWSQRPFEAVELSEPGHDSAVEANEGVSPQGR